MQPPSPSPAAEPAASGAASSLISASQLHGLLASATPCMVLDCSYDLTQPDAGRQQYESAHIPGAMYADLHRDLSAAPDDPAPASGGRHPLPSRERLAQWLGSLGLTPDTRVVVYDRNGMAMCARLWWMLKWIGHDAVQVLDGALPAWQAAGFALESGTGAARPATTFTPGPALRRLVGVDEVLAGLGRNDVQTLIDARAGERYRGEVEPLDPVAGHIPGALNRPFGHNIAADGRFKPAALLRTEFDALLAERDPATVVHHCGSGVTALPNLLAMELAGYPPTALFAGSWSQWCSDPGRPVARGA